MELRCSSYDYVMDMTWREFRLRRAGYFREFKEKWRRTREVAYHIYLTIPEKGKKMPIDKFMKLDNDSKSGSALSNRQKEVLKAAHKKAVEEAKRL